MMLHGSQSPTPSLTPHQSPIAPPPPPATTNVNATTPRKRKADSQDNERLTKRLSLLNIEQNGSKLYVPVETPSATSINNVPTPHPHATVANTDHDDDMDDMMRLDDTKHKVYIYDLDDELTSEDDDSDSRSDDGRLIFLPDIEKHLKANRIPPHVLANSDGELAGMQMVLYSDPKSLSVPEDKDGVRKAIIEARQRLRDKQSHEGGHSPTEPAPKTTPPQAVASLHAGMAVERGPPDSPDAMDMD